MSAAAFPKWAILEPFVFRRDDEESFPDDSEAPIMASGNTSWKAPFRIAFSLAEPPLISRLYAHLPGFADPRKQTPLAILATHRHLALIRVAAETRAPETNGLVTVQDFFIYNACSADNPSSLEALPPCTLAYPNYTRRGGPQPRRPSRYSSSPPKKEASEKRRLLTVRSMGLLCQGGGFVVAELSLYKPSRTEVYADICLFKSAESASGSQGDQLAGRWSSERVSILCSDNPDDIWQLCCWQTDAVIPSARWLCWIDYYRGILFCDVFGDPIPTVSFLRFPLDRFPDTHNRSKACSWLYRGVSAIHNGYALKFVSVDRDDGIGYGALKPGAAFTITCHTLDLRRTVLNNVRALGRVKWNKDGMATSSELWADSSCHHFPRETFMFPLVNIDRPHVVHFLVSEFGLVMKKMWLVTIDMKTRTVESVSQYIKGREDLGTVDADLTKRRSSCPTPFLRCEFSKYLRFSRKRKDIE